MPMTEATAPNRVRHSLRPAFSAARRADSTADARRKDRGKFISAPASARGPRSSGTDLRRRRRRARSTGVSPHSVAWRSAAPSDDARFKQETLAVAGRLRSARTLHATHVLGRYVMAIAIHRSHFAVAFAPLIRFGFPEATGRLQDARRSSKTAYETPFVSRVTRIA